MLEIGRKSEIYYEVNTWHLSTLWQFNHKMSMTPHTKQIYSLFYRLRISAYTDFLNDMISYMIYDRYNISPLYIS